MNKFLAAALGVFATFPAMAAQFWLSGVDPVIVKAAHLTGPNDYMDLFAPGAPWQDSEARLNVFKISTQMVLMGSDAMLRDVFGAMARRHVAMAIEMGTVLQPSNDCGGGEGYTHPGTVERVGSRLQSLGLRLDYVAMDEPVWFAHERSWGKTQGRPDCQFSLPEVARRVAISVATMRRYIPDIQFGDIEVVADKLPPSQVMADYTEFGRLFEQNTGLKLAFYHADVAWQGDWQQPLIMFAQQARAHHIRYGVIVGGSPEDGSDEEWAQDAMDRLRRISANPVTKPQDVVVQSWQVMPTRYLPESMAGTSTNLLARTEILLP